MECFKVYSDEIEGRMDPPYLKTIFLVKNVNIKYPLVALGNLLKERPQYGANEIAIDGNPEVDIRYIRITDIDEFGNLKDEDWKTAKKIDGKYLLEGNDILFARSGATAGKTFIYRPEFGKAIFAGYLIRFKIDDTKANPLFVFYYTQSKRYALWVKSIQRPSGQPNINSEEFKSFEIPLPPHPIQNSIAEIMESAYALKKQIEQEAKELLDSINGYVLSELSIKTPPKEKKMCYAVYSNDIEERIDPSPYHPIRMSTIKVIKSSKNKIYYLKNIVNFKRKIITSNNQNLPYIGLENIESNTGRFIPSKEVKESFGSAFQFNKGDILFPKLRPYLNKVYLAEFEGVCSTEFHVIEPEECNNLYLSVFLRSKLMVNQTSYLMTGNTLPRLQTVDVENLLIPVQSQDIQNKIAEEVDRRMERAKQLEKEARMLLEGAKAKVEKIILGEDEIEG